MDAHLDVLLEWAMRWERGEAADEDVYVWWAKLRSENRQQPLPHADDVLALDAQVAAGVETLLYLTDYRSLYVGEVGRITAEDVLADTTERVHAPSYYNGLIADFWFQLHDMRRLVVDDTRETIEILRTLKNVHYNGRPVSLYGGMVNLPLVVTAEREVSYFDEAADEALLSGGLWAQHDAAQHGDVARLEKELRDHLLGPRAWLRLDAAARSFLAGAEAILRPHLTDGLFDFTPAVLGYAKAVEVQLNTVLFAILRTALRGAAERDRLVRVASGALLDPTRERIPHQTLGTLARMLEKDDAVRRGLKLANRGDLTWWTIALPRELSALAEVRNAGAHSARVGRDAALELRASILGIGCRGLMVALAEA